MMLPNAHVAVVDPEKIRDYLLNAGHPDNGGKANFFKAAGFSAGAWELLAEAIRQMAVRTAVAATAASAHGTKYVVEGLLEGPSGAVGPVRSVWIMDRGSATPRLVTAYPCV